MKRAIIQVRPDADAAFAEEIEKTKRAMRTGIPSDPLATFTFSTLAQMFGIFSMKRWELIEQLQKIGPSSIRALTRELGRDVRRVHDDVMVLIEWGIIEKNEDGKVFVPFDVIHIGVDIRAAA